MTKWKPSTQAFLAHGAYWAAAIATGVVAVAFAKTAAFSESLFHAWFAHQAWTTLLGTPLLFLAAAALVVYFAPRAEGAGIPQVLKAISLTPEQADAGGYVAIKTTLVKWLSATLVFLSGASAGREGPTVQMASSVFWWVGKKASKFGVKADLRSFLVAGGAAGIAAAFNTPLAGITFALEELAHQHFHSFKQDVILAVVLAGITARMLVGDYLYFGHPQVPEEDLFLYASAVAIGALAGAMGGLFAVLVGGNPLKKMLPAWWARALAAGFFCAVAGYLTLGLSAGSGYEAIRPSMEAGAPGPPNWFFGVKFLTTLATYSAGMAGGVFAPCLSIGAGLGSVWASFFQLSAWQACGLLGMVGFFTGVIGAPLTGVVIVMEMTDDHGMILPLFIAAFCAHAVAKKINPVPLYARLSERYNQGHAH